MAELDFYVFSKLVSERGTVALRLDLVDITGDLLAGLLLSQILYWNLPDKEGKTKLRVIKDNKLWLVKARHDWWDECRLTDKQARRALAILDQQNLIISRIYKFAGAPTRHIRLNEDVLMAKLAQWYSSPQLGEIPASSEEMGEEETEQPPNIDESMSDEGETEDFLADVFSEPSTPSDSPKGQSDIAQLGQSITETTPENTRDQSEYRLIPPAAKGQTAQVTVRISGTPQTPRAIKEKSVYGDTFVQTVLSICNVDPVAASGALRGRCANVVSKLRTLGITEDQVKSWYGNSGAYYAILKMKRAPAYPEFVLQTASQIKNIQTKSGGSEWDAKMFEQWDAVKGG